VDIINSNRLRVSLRFFRPGYAERFWDFGYGSWHSSDHGKPRLETTIHAKALGIVADVKWRPDGKYPAVGKP
jgi:hypothetical protein